MRKEYFVFALLTLCVVSCSEQKTMRPFWDEERGLAEIPALGIAYSVPTPKDRWMIAPMDGSIPAIKFCGIDTETEVCVAIVDIGAGVSNVVNLKYSQIQETLQDIICQLPQGSILNYEPQIERSGYLGSDSWKFNVNMSIINASDTIDVFYSGYFFDSDSNVAGILLTVPAQIRDSLGTAALDCYLLGLSRLAQE